jgi:hypothetical protein
MPIRDTSAEAYRELQPKLAGLQARVYDAIAALNRRGIHSTDREIAKEMGVHVIQARAPIGRPPTTDFSQPPSPHVRGSQF